MTGTEDERTAQRVLVNPGKTIDTTPGTPAFDKFRPKFHILPFSLWLNDPCGPFYLPETDTYHVYYQYNPYGSAWGNMAWGHASSKDLITWEDHPVALHPDAAVDHLGVFTGGVWPVGYKGQPTVYYTGVSGLPLSWVLTYTPGFEKVAMATSPDGGITWVKREEAVINGPPEGMEVTGWRDPYIFTSPELDELYGVKSTPTTHYMTVSGGERSLGGRLFLYSTLDWLKWDYKGTLVDAPLEEIEHCVDVSSSEWIGSFGANFEVANFFTLKDESGEKHHFSIIGTEGGRGLVKDNHWPLWISGDLAKNDDGQVKLNITHRGIGDCGPEYASNSFWDTKGKRQILYGWIFESNGYDGGQQQPQGWAGMFTLPRELFVVMVHNVLDPNETLKTFGPYKVYPGPEVAGKPTKIIKTLGTRPIKEFEAARADTEVYRHTHKKSITKPTPPSSTNEEAEAEAAVELLPVSSLNYEIVAKATLVPKGGRIGFVVRHTESRSEETLIYYDDTRGRIVVDRSKNSVTPEVNRDEDSGKFELFDLACDSPGSKPSVRETLDLRIFVDNSVIEVYANDRFALSTRIYPDENDDAVKISLYGLGKNAHFDDVTIYSGFKNIFPNRKY